MTSVSRTYGVKKEALTRFIKPESPCYYDDNNDVLFPFSYSNQVLDISYTGNTFKANMVDTLNREPDSETTSAIQILGGPVLATSLGENFKNYVRSWRDGSIDAGSPIEVFTPPQLLRVQEVSYEHVSADSGDSWKISTTRPSGENYTIGDSADKYRTTYIFKTPLTFTIVEGGVTQYITFRTMLDQE
jgi:hypothetical protein